MRWTYEHGDVPGMLGQGHLMDDELWLDCGIILDPVTGEVPERSPGLVVTEERQNAYDGQVVRSDSSGRLTVTLPLWREGDEDTMVTLPLDTEPYSGRPVLVPVRVEPAPGALVVAVDLRYRAVQPQEYKEGRTIVYGVR